MSVLTKRFEARASLPDTHPLSAYLYELMEAKKTNLCLSADVGSSSGLIRAAEEVGDYICVLKTHADMIDDFSERTVKKLKELSRAKKFLIFEDRKFGDIGSTVQKQYTGGPIRIADWAHIVNAHVFPGPAIVTALKQAADMAVAKLSRTVSTEVYADTPVVSGDDYDDEDEDDNNRQNGQGEGGKQGTKGSKIPRQANSPFARKDSIVTTTHIYQTVEHREGHRSPKRMRSPPNESALEEEDDEPEEEFPEPPTKRGLLLLAQMSSAGNLMDGAYTKACVDLARQNRDFVMGFISQENLNDSDGDNFVCMTPGVNLPEPGSSDAVKGDSLGQQYRTPEKVIVGEGVDMIIVGRGILNAKNRAAEARRYRDEAWKAYQQRLKT